MKFKNIFFCLIFTDYIVSVNIFRREKDVLFDRKLVLNEKNINKFGIYHKSFLPKKKISFNSNKQISHKENNNHLYVKIDGKRKLLSQKIYKNNIKKEQKSTIKKNPLEKKYNEKISSIKQLLAEDNEMLSKMKNNLFNNHNRKLKKGGPKKKDSGKDDNGGEGEGTEAQGAEGELEEEEEIEEEEEEEEEGEVKEEKVKEEEKLKEEQKVKEEEKLKEEKKVKEEKEIEKIVVNQKLKEEKISQEENLYNTSQLPEVTKKPQIDESINKSSQSELRPDELKENPFKDIEDTNQQNPIIIINQSIHQNMNKDIYNNHGQNQSLSPIQTSAHENGTPIVNEAKEEIQPVYYDQFGAVISNEENPQTKIVNGEQVIFAHELSKHPIIRYNYNKNGIFEEKNDIVTFQEIDTLVDLLNSINGIFQQYFLIMPKENELVAVKADNDDEKTALDKTLEVLNFYKKMRNFVNTIIYNRQQLINDIHFLQSRTDKLKATEDDMLEFYDLEHQYFRAKMGAALYEKKDPKFSAYFMNIHELTLGFETDLRKIIKEVYNLSKFNDFFQSVIDELGNTSQTVNILIVLDTIDKILMLLLRLYEFKSEIKLTIQTTQISLTNLKLYRRKIEIILDNVNKLTEFYKIDLAKIKDDQEQMKKNGSSIFYTFFVVIGILLI